jgi:uncharacterized membrane protein YdjX (TVP38/TMEM64 family)
MNKTLRIIQIVLIVIVTIIIIVLIPDFKNLTSDEISDYIPKSIILASLLLLGLYCLKAITIVIPAVLLYIIAGVIFPPIPAIVVTLTCLIIELTIGYYVGRYLGQKRVMKLVDRNKHLNRIIRYIKNKSLTSCFVVSFVPGFPIDLTSMLFGASNTKYYQFLAGSLLGLTPAMIPIVLIGNYITDPLSKEFMIPFSICVAISLSSLLFYYIWLKGRRAQNHKKDGSVSKKISTSKKVPASKEISVSDEHTSVKIK